MKYKEFEDYLKEVFEKDFAERVLDDDLNDAYDNWVCGLDGEELIHYADKYAEIKYKEGQEQMYESMAEQNKTFMEVNKKILDSFK